MAREDPLETVGDVYDQETIIKYFNMKSIAEASGDSDDVKLRSGSLGAMETSQLPHEDHPHAMAALDRLPRVVQADARLGRG
ncbi:hypothetical protein ACIBMX_03805 [Streptomyces phaeochromogenes]|uniref:hypothetical protein n=1 Tax=Streptomyces phaeochromogenes TaxID=1923 RepID=UPI0033D338DD